MKKSTAKKAVKLFLDSNVILSGLLSKEGAPRILLDILSLRLPFLSAATGKYNIIEIERNLEKKMPAVIPLYKEYFPKLNLKVVSLPSSDEVRKYSKIIKDKDAPVLASAVKNKADFLVTGDKRDFSKLKKTGSFPFKIVSPSEFLDTILPELLKYQS